jgi:hypothetical protein
MRPLFFDHELVMTSNQLTFQVQKRAIPKNFDTGKSGTGKAPLSPDSLTAAPPPRSPRRSRAGAFVCRAVSASWARSGGECPGTCRPSTFTHSSVETLSRPDTIP